MSIKFTLNFEPDSLRIQGIQANRVTGQPHLDHAVLGQLPVMTMENRLLLADDEVRRDLYYGDIGTAVDTCPWVIQGDIWKQQVKMIDIHDSESYHYREAVVQFEPGMALVTRYGFFESSQEAYAQAALPAIEPIRESQKALSADQGMVMEL